MLKLTDAATRKLSEVITQQSEAGGSVFGLRLSVYKGGCSGYQYGMSLYGVDFYAGKRTPIVDDLGEVRYGSEQLPVAERERYFLTSDSFFRLVRETDGLYCATQNDEKLERLKKEVPALRVLWHNEAYSLVELTRS